MRRAIRRQPVQEPLRNRSRLKRFIAPVRGWVLDENLSTAREGAAQILDNWIPTLTGIRVRNGATRHATIPDKVESLFVYRSGLLTRLFACTATNIYDVTTPANPLVAATPVFSGQTSGKYSTTHISASGGDYLIAVNGTDTPIIFDGSTWSTANITATPQGGSPIDIARFSNVWEFAERLWFVEGGTLSAWYLDINSIGGTATEFPLRTILQSGGTLLFGDTWSSDAGDGLDDRCVFVTTRGGVAVYQGTDLINAGGFQRVGRYDITPPRGPKATTRIGGNLIIGTDEGLIPTSEAVQQGDIALSLSSLSKDIEGEWQRQARIRPAQNWEIVRWPENNIALVALPSPNDGLENECFLVNLETNAWSRVTGWDAQTITYFNGNILYGDRVGGVFITDNGGTDDGANFTALCVLQPSDLSAPARQKIVHMARGTFLASTPFIFNISAVTDYMTDAGAAPNSSPEFRIPLWDTAVWDVDTWDGGGSRTVSTRWASIGRSGFAVSPVVQVTSGTNLGIDAELVSVDVTYEIGGIAV